MNLNQLSYIYILASKKNDTLYVGVTSKLKKRIFQYKEGLYDSFIKKYKVKLLQFLLDPR